MDGDGAAPKKGSVKKRDVDGNASNIPPKPNVHSRSRSRSRSPEDNKSKPAGAAARTGSRPASPKARSGAVAAVTAPNHPDGFNKADKPETTKHGKTAPTPPSKPARLTRSGSATQESITVSSSSSGTSAAAASASSGKGPGSEPVTVTRPRSRTQPSKSSKQDTTAEIGSAPIKASPQSKTAQPSKKASSPARETTKVTAPEANKGAVAAKETASAVVSSKNAVASLRTEGKEGTLDRPDSVDIDTLPPPPDDENEDDLKKASAESAPSTKPKPSKAQKTTPAAPVVNAPTPKKPIVANQVPPKPTASKKAKPVESGTFPRLDDDDSPDTPDQAEESADGMTYVGSVMQPEKSAHTSKGKHSAPSAARSSASVAEINPAEAALQFEGLTETAETAPSSSTTQKKHQKHHHQKHGTETQGSVATFPSMDPSFKKRQTDVESRGPNPPGAQEEEIEEAKSPATRKFKFFLEFSTIFVYIWLIIGFFSSLPSSQLLNSGHYWIYSKGAMSISNDVAIVANTTFLPVGLTFCILGLCVQSALLGFIYIRHWQKEAADEAEANLASNVGLVQGSREEGSWLASSMKSTEEWIQSLDANRWVFYASVGFLILCSVTATILGGVLFANQGFYQSAAGALTSVVASNKTIAQQVESAAGCCYSTCEPGVTARLCGSALCSCINEFGKTQLEQTSTWSALLLIFGIISLVILGGIIWISHIVHFNPNEAVVEETANDIRSIQATPFEDEAAAEVDQVKSASPHMASQMDSQQNATNSVVAVDQEGQMGEERNQ